MNLSKNNLFIMYYHWVYGKYPENICIFTWASLLAIVTFPLTVIGTLIDRKIYSYEGKYIPDPIASRIVVGGMVIFLITLISSVGNRILESFGYEFIYWWSISILGFLLGLVCFVSIIGIIYSLYIIIIRICRYRREKKYLKKISESKMEPKGPTFIDNIQVFVGAVRGKYCTKIIIKD